MKERGLVFGQKCTVSLARYDQDTRSLRMYQCSLFGEEQELLQTLPKSGCIVNGKLSEQTKWELGTEERESGLWLTPSTVQKELTKERREKRIKFRKSIGRKDLPGSLAEQVAIKKFHPKMFPTPTTADTWTDKLKSSQQKEGSMHSVNLSQAVHMKEMFPKRTYLTPAATEGFRSNFTLKQNGKKRNHSLGSITEQIAQEEIQKNPEATGTLNSEWVEWLMGFPIGWTEVIGVENQKVSPELKQDKQKELKDLED